MPDSTTAEKPVTVTATDLPSSLRDALEAAGYDPVLVVVHEKDRLVALASLEDLPDDPAQRRYTTTADYVRACPGCKGNSLKKPYTSGGLTICVTC